MKKTGIVNLSRPRFGKRSPATSVHPRIKRLKSFNPLTTARIYIYLLDNYGIGIPMSKHTKVPRSEDNPEVAESFSKLSRPRFGKRSFQTYWDSDWSLKLLILFSINSCINIVPWPCFVLVQCTPLKCVTSPPSKYTAACYRFLGWAVHEMEYAICTHWTGMFFEQFLLGEGVIKMRLDNCSYDPFSQTVCYCWLYFLFLLDPSRKVINSIHYDVLKRR